MPLLSEIFATLGLANIPMDAIDDTVAIIKTPGGVSIEVGFLSEISIKKVGVDYHIHLHCRDRQVVLCYSSEENSNKWHCLNDPDSHDKDSSFPVLVKFIRDN